MAHGIPRTRLLPESPPGDALIGHTGFVGGNLARARRFESLYNSADIETIRGRTFDTIVCAGVRAEKWRANRDPEDDLASIDRMWSALREAKASKLILISTIDVYPTPHGVDENTAIDPAKSEPYGRHRYDLETRARDHFETMIVRLPGLFGKGLKKNALYDLLHSHETEKIDSRGVFQFYDVARLAADIDIAAAHEIALLNVATEPVSIEEVSLECFGELFVNHVVDSPARYDIRSIHAGLFGGTRGYLVDRASVKDSLRQWVVSERAGVA